MPFQPTIGTYLAVAMLCIIAALLTLLLIALSWAGPKVGGAIGRLARFHVLVAVAWFVLYVLLSAGEAWVGGRPSKGKVEGGVYYVREKSTYYAVPERAFRALLAARRGLVIGGSVVLLPLPVSVFLLSRLYRRREAERNRL